MPNANPAAAALVPASTGNRASIIEAWADTLLGRAIDRRYRIDSVLGYGAVGVVFRGTHLRLDKPVAVKVFQQAFRLGDTFRARFEREALSASRLSHPNCVDVIDYGEDDGLTYFVMPFIEGVALSKLLGDDMTTARALALFDQVLAGLHHAHTRGLIHRDVKPENILVVRDHAGNEQVKLIDFGIAKVDDPTDGKQLTSAGDVIGTPQYMSPEQCRGAAVTERTDLYSAGLVLHELLTGQMAFDAPDFLEVLRLQLVAPPPPLPPQFHSSIGPLRDRLLAKKPEARFASVAEAREALAAIREGRPIGSLTARGKTEPSPLELLEPVPGPMGSVASSLESGFHPALRVPAPDNRRGPLGTEILVNFVELTTVKWAPLLERRSPAPRPPSHHPVITAVLVAVAIIIIGLLVGSVVQRYDVSSGIAQLMVAVA